MDMPLVLVVGVLTLILSPQLPGPAAPEVGIGQVQVSGAAGDVTLPTVESIRSEDATVYEMKVFGEGDQVTQLVMIFDEGIDL